MLASVFGDGAGDCEKTLAAIETATNPAQKNRNMRDVDLSRIWPLLNSGSWVGNLTLVGRAEPIS